MQELRNVEMRTSPWLLTPVLTLRFMKDMSQDLIQPTAAALLCGSGAVQEKITLTSPSTATTMGSKRAPSCSLLLGFYAFVATAVAVIFGSLYFSSTCEIITSEKNNGSEQKIIVKQNNLDFLNYDDKKSKVLIKVDVYNEKVMTKEELICKMINCHL